MQLMDADGDGKISQAEYKAWRYRVAHRRFAAIDANRDGKIDLNEFLQAYGEHERARFYWLDTANKGFISDDFIERAEATEADEHAAIFSKQDGDADGKIGWPEWHNFWQTKMKAIFTRHDTNNDGSLEFAEAHPKIDTRIASNFKEYDTDGDGFINETEFVAAVLRIAKEKAERMFNEIDED